MRLLGRIWLHGALLCIGITAVVMFARFVMPREDAIMALRAHPSLARGLADSALEARADPAALARALAVLERDLSLDVSVFRADGALLASSTATPLAAASPGELAGLAATSAPVVGERYVVGTFRDGKLEAYAVAALPRSLIWPMHVTALIVLAVVLALMFVAIPLSRSIARPLAKLGALARELGSGNLAVRSTDHARRDEIGELSRAFNDMAVQIQQLRSTERRLLADVSHELRTPLARIRVILDLASDADLDKVRRYQAEITTDLSELEQLLDDTIVSSRLDTEEARWDEIQPPLRTRELELGELVDASTTRFRERWPNRSLIAACGPAAASIAIEGDLVMLRRVLDNLVDNARKYSSESQPIELRVVPDAGRVRIEVIDHGIGIAREDQPRVFTPFFRADRSRTRATGGVGLGLALARRIVVAHGGSVGFASEPGRGSTFWLELPAPDFVGELPALAAAS